MNIFFVDGKYYSYLHFKIILEILQMLFTAHRLHGAPDSLPEGAYKLSHPDHPMTKWVCGSRENYLRAVEKGEELLEEYYKRYGTKKRADGTRGHKCEAPLRWLAAHVPAGLPSSGLTVPPCLEGNGVVWYPATWGELVRAHERIYRTTKRAIAMKMGKCPTGIVRIPLPVVLEASPLVSS